MSNSILSFSGEYGFLSNFYPCSIIDEIYKITFPTAEHFYQSRKTNSMVEKLRCAEFETAGQVKRYGQKITLRKDWEDIKVFQMGIVVCAKFVQYPELMKKLVDTKDSTLVEGNQWHDKFWGKCYCEQCNGEGDNMLGKILMGLRYHENFKYKPKPFTFNPLT